MEKHIGHKRCFNQCFKNECVVHKVAKRELCYSGWEVQPIRTERGERQELKVLTCASRMFSSSSDDLPGFCLGCVKSCGAACPSQPLTGFVLIKHPDEAATLTGEAECVWGGGGEHWSEVELLDFLNYSI